MARPGIEPRTSDLRVRCPTDCATRPGTTDKEENIKMTELLPLKVCPFTLSRQVTDICHSISLYSVPYSVSGLFMFGYLLFNQPEFCGEWCRTCPPLDSHPHKKVMIISGRRNKCGNFIESTWIFSFVAF